jgi:cation transport ATPase
MNSPDLIRRHSASSAPLEQRGDSSDRPKADDGTEPPEHEQGFEWMDLVRIGFVALAAAAVWLRLWEPFAHFSVIGLAAALIGGYPILKEAIENIVERKMTMELSMTIALLAALAIGEFFTALVITAFVLGAEVLEGLTVGRGRRAIQDLLDFSRGPYTSGAMGK